jgi:hypothetical protein
MKEDIRPTLECYVEDCGDIVAIKIVVDENLGEKCLSVYGVKSNDLNDSIYDKADLFHAYGDHYWYTLEDFKNDNVKLFEDWFVSVGFDE